MRRPSLILLVVLAACGDSAVTTTSPSTEATTTTAAVSTTEPNTTTTSVAPTTTTTFAPAEPITVSSERATLTEGTVTTTIDRPIVAGGAAGVAEAIQGVIDVYLAAASATFAAEASDAGTGAVAEFEVSQETFLGEHTVSIRFTEYHGVQNWAHPYVAVEEMTFSAETGRRLSVTDLDGADEEPLSSIVWQLLHENLTEVTGDASLADAVLTSPSFPFGAEFVVTADGIEITLAEADGVPHVYGPITTRIHWDTIPAPSF